MNGLALAGSWQVAAEYQSHCQTHTSDCEEVASVARRVLVSAALLNCALLGGLDLGALGRWLIHGLRNLPRKVPQALVITPTTAGLVTLFAGGSSLLSAITAVRSAETAIADMLDDFGRLLATAWAEFFTSFFTSLATVLNW
jgi:hypothetical protein